MPLNDFARVMGHEQISTTLDRYTHPSDRAPGGRRRSPSPPRSGVAGQGRSRPEPTTRWCSRRPARAPRPGGAARRCRRSFTAVGDHHGQIDQNPAPVMNREHAGPGQRSGQGAGQPGPVHEHPQQRRADMRHHTSPVRGDPQFLRPRRRLHAGSASLAAKPVDVAITSFPCQSGAFVYSHADRTRQTMITVNHPG
nr:hypothetical protein [Krasilnikovia cinnamomea]